jgi:glycerate kinase
MRILVAPQEFKGSLTARQAASCMAAACRRTIPGVEADEVPMSDGGSGMVEAVVAARRGILVDAPCVDPLLRPIKGEFGLIAAQLAVIEMAAASGLVLLLPSERDPLIATTRGTGDLIRAALDEGVAEILLGVGGSATVDGGGGALQALGARLLDASGDDLPPGGAPLAYLDTIDVSGLDPRLASTAIRIACDVTNPLVGPNGAAAVFGPQKGADSGDVRVLDGSLSHFADVLAAHTGMDVRSLPGIGAAGGLPAALVALAGATITPGFDLVAQVVGLEAKVEAADVVLTGEGRLDSQTAFGKTASGMARLAHAHGKRVGAVVGHIDASYQLGDEFGAIEQLVEDETQIEAAMVDADRLLDNATQRILRRMFPDSAR